VLADLGPQTLKRRGPLRPRGAADLGQPAIQLGLVCAVKGDESGQVVTLFYEPSTRTRVSFETAARALGAEVVTVTVATSSVDHSAAGC